MTFPRADRFLSLLPGRPPGLWILALLVLCPSTLSCDSFGEQNAFADDARRPPSGITRTDENGAVQSEDEDDWRTAPLYRGAVRFDPAYPNPTSGEVRVTLPFLVTDFNSIQGGLILRGYDDADEPRFVLLDEVQDAGETGFHTFTFPVSLLSASGSVSEIEGLHRLFVLDARGEVVTYGDLRVELPEE